MPSVAIVLVVIVAVLRDTSSTSAPCITIDLPDFLTTNQSCSNVKATDICVSFNEKDTAKVRDVINCTIYDAEYKVAFLTAVMVDAVAATLPEELRNMSWTETEFIVRWCSNGYSLPKSQSGLTCEEYLSLVNVTCEEPTSLIVPDVNGLGQCAEKATVPDLCAKGDELTWPAFTELIALLRCVYFALIPLLPTEEY